VDFVSGEEGLLMAPVYAVPRMLAKLGLTFQDFDFYENMRGGKLVVYGESISAGQPRVIAGNAQITDFKIVNAPILARLLNVISLTGLQQLLGSDGISFSKLQAEFEWRMEQDGDLYKLREGKTSGASIGLTFDGIIDETAEKIDISGTIVPISVVNTMISKIPLVGNILAGGKNGAVLAATYALKGDPERPEVSVNPLAALAPGILRKLLFEGEKKSDQKPDSPPPEKPAPAE
jgi:hypothetical protein